LAKAITANTSKLAQIMYTLLQHGTAYVTQGLAAYETAYRERMVRQMKRKAAELDLVIVEREAVAQPA
jgi:transposase